MSIDADHFLHGERGLSAHPWMQHRRVAYGYAEGAARTFAPINPASQNVDIPIHSVTATWKNDTPVPQYVYGMVTRDGCQITLQARTRAYLKTLHGQMVNSDPNAAVPLTAVSKVGVGLDVGRGGILGGIRYGIGEIRQNSRTVPLMPMVPNWTVLLPGQRFTAAVELRFVSEFWENTTIDGGSSATESRIITGDTRLDLFAAPALTAPVPARLLPTLVGHSSATGFGGLFVSPVTVSRPAGVQADDTLIAVVCNQYGDPNSILAPRGWTRLYGAGLNLYNDTHMVIFHRRATDDEPPSYQFGGGFMAETIAEMLVVRDASPLLSEWTFGARLFQPWLWEAASKQQVVPEIPGDGDLMLAMSYLSTGNGQHITQALPGSLTPIDAVVGDMSTFAIGSVDSPPNPTQEVTFTASDTPAWLTGHSIAAGLLVPGRWG